MPDCRMQQRGLTLLEMLISLLLIIVLLAVLLPALSSARTLSFRDHCQSNQGRIGQGWQMYWDDHNNAFPTVHVQPGWFYAGMRFSAVNDAAFPDSQRPLNPYLPLRHTSNYDEVACCCPADRGISDPITGSGTGRRTAFRSFGTSYRANAALLLWQGHGAGDVGAEAEIDREVKPKVEPRGLFRDEISTTPSRLVLLGDAFWYEVAETTGRQADWHGKPQTGNILFMDGSVRYLSVKPRQVIGPVVFDPTMPGSAQSPAE